MIFGDTPLDDAEDAILAHGLRREGLILKKGRRLSAEDVATLRAAGLESVIAARLEPGDLHEDEAAARLAETARGDGIGVSAAFTGRSNLAATARGLLVVDQDRLDAFNLVDEAVTLATLPAFSLVEPRQMVATAKILPFAVPRAIFARCLAAIEGDRPLLRVAALRPRRVGLIQTLLPGLKPGLLDKTREAMDARLAALDCPPCEEHRVAHESEAVAGAIGALRQAGCEIVLVMGASAVVDRRDVVPSGIVAAGGTIDHFGMPVDPGNLLLLGHDRAGPVLGVPGCARSPKLNGFDRVLQRLVAGLPVTGSDIMRMGAGGLLTEIPLRGLPRAKAVESPEPPLPEPPLPEPPPRAPRIAALVLAAGRSTRMGAANKLLTEVGGQAMVAQAVRSARASRAETVFLVTGHEAERVSAAVTGLGVDAVLHNPDFASGLSGSLHRGLALLPGDCDGVVVCLADMPLVGPEVIDRLIAAYAPLEGRSICLPVWQGKRGNPVLLGRQHFAEVQAITGDVGAKALIAQYPDAVAEVPMPDDSVLIDIDTPEALRAVNAAG